MSQSNINNSKIDWSKVKYGDIFPLPEQLSEQQNNNRVICNIVLKNETTFEEKPILPFNNFLLNE